jgi:hypothetical protein
MGREGVGTIDIMAKGVNQSTTIEELVGKIAQRLELEQKRVGTHLSSDVVIAAAHQEFQRLTHLSRTGIGNWHNDIPGRVVLNRFANASGMKAGRLKTLYLRHAKGFHPDPFAEIRAIFAGYRVVSRSAP